MQVPTYQTKWGSEAAWTAVIGSITGLVGLVMAQNGASAELVAAVVSVIGATSRLVIGALLPSPGGDV